MSDCKVCLARASCTGTTRRTLTLHPKEQMRALFAARQREGTDEFKDTYRHGAGIEGTPSQGVYTMGLRRSRSIGLPKTPLAHVAVATAINVVQLMRQAAEDGAFDFATSIQCGQEPLNSKIYIMPIVRSGKAAQSDKKCEQWVTQEPFGASEKR